MFHEGRKAYITYLLIILNVVIYVIFSWRNSFLYIDTNVLTEYGFSPIDMRGLRGLETLITSMFIHGNIFHIFFNMFVLYYFGRELETLLNGFRYLILYIISGVIGSLFYSITLPVIYSTFNIYAVGASGAISGLLGGFFILYPHRILTLCIFTPIPICGSFNASIFLMIWIFINLVYGIFIGGNIAFFAHIGGFVGGVVLAYVLARNIVMEMLPRDKYLYEILMSYKGRGLGFFSKTISLLLISIPMIIVIFNFPHIYYISDYYGITTQIMFSSAICILVSITSIYIVLFKDKELDIS